MRATVEKKSTQKKKKKAPAKKTAEVQVDGNALKKAIAVREPKKMFNHGEIWATNLELDQEKNKYTRVFKTFPMESEIEDLTTVPNGKENLIAETIKKAHEAGYVTSDDTLIGTSIATVEEALDQLIHDVRYSEPPCKKRDNLIEVLELLVSNLRETRRLCIDRLLFKSYLKSGKLNKMPRVLPPGDEYYIANGEFVKRPKSATITSIGKEVPENVRELAKKLSKLPLEKK